MSAECKPESVFQVIMKSKVGFLPWVMYSRDMSTFVYLTLWFSLWSQLSHLKVS